LDKKEHCQLPVRNLPEGKHHEAFELESDFFSGTFLEGIAELHVALNVFFERSDNIINGYIEFEALGRIECDRCLELCDIDFENDADFIIKIGDTVKDVREEDSVFFVKDDDEFFDMTDFIIAEVMLSLPTKCSHGFDENGKSLCDNEVARLLKKYEVNESEPPPDPRWNGLKNIKFN